MDIGDMEETIERLTREKVELTKLHNQEMLIKDKKLNQLVQFIGQLEDQNDRLQHRLEQLQGSIICSTQSVNALLATLEFDQSIDDKQILEDLKKLQMNEINKNISILQKNSRSHSDFSQQEFEVNPLETAISNLEKGWQTLLKRALCQQKDQSLMRYLKQQVSNMQEEQRTLRVQKKNLQDIHNQLQKSRHEISEKINKQIQSNLKIAKIDLEKMSTSELKEKVGELTSAVSILKQKVQRLQIQLYQTKSQYADKLEAIKLKSAQIKERSQKEITRKEKEIFTLRSEIVKK